MVIDGYTTPGTERETALSAEQLLRAMDLAGVDRAVIAPEDREIAVDNAAGNARILKMAAESRERFIPACSVSPWRGEEGCALLRDAARHGAKMLVLAPMLQGFIPTDEIADPLLAVAADLRIVVYVHTGAHSAGGPTQVVLMAERHPGANFILGHCGSTDYAWDMPAILQRHRLPNVWYDLGLVRPWVAPNYAKMAGASRLVFSSSMPRNDLPFEIGQLRQHLPPEEFPDIYGGNLARLLSNAE